jgi:hypothetical protein
MGWNWRRSLRFGPLKINLSKSGVGYSVGLPGVRLGTDAKGRKYQSLNIPGTGIYRRDYASSQANPTNQPSGRWFTAPRLYIIGLVFLALLWAIIKFFS